MMAVNLHHLELFYYVARHRGIAEAVRHIPYGIQAPAVSGQVRALEQSLGAELFVRRPFQLTPAGETLFDFASYFFEGMDAMCDRVRNRVATIRIAASEIILRDYLPPVIERLRRTLPNIPFVLQPRMRREMLQGLADRTIDIALGPLADCLDKPLASQRIVSVLPALLVPKTFPAAAAKAWWLPPLCAQPLISPPADEPVTRSFAAGLRARGLVWPTSLEVGSVALIAHYVASGHGVGLTVDVPALVERPGVRRVRLPDFTPIDISLAWRTPLSREQALLLEELRREIVAHTHRNGAGVRQRGGTAPLSRAANHPHAAGDNSPDRVPERPETGAASAIPNGKPRTSPRVRPTPARVVPRALRANPHPPGRGSRFAYR